MSKLTKNLKKLAFSVAVIAGATSSFIATAQAKSCGEVTITEMDWASASVVTAVSKFLMEEGYGCKVTKVPSSTNPALASVTETGEPDILTEIWSNGAPAYNKLVKSGKIKPLTNVLSDGGVNGWWIPNYMIEKHPELATLKGIMANPDLVGGRFHNSPVGWTNFNINNNIAKAAGLEKAGIKLFTHGSGDTLAASIAAAFESKTPWFGYYWAPTAILGKYPMTMIDLGTYSKSAHDCNKTADCATPKLSSYPREAVTTVVAKQFAKRNPAVTKMMSKLQFTNAKMGEILSWKQSNKATAEEAAVYFITNNSDIWSKWLNKSARAKLSVLIK